MRDYEITGRLDRKLRRLDSRRFAIVEKKLREIVMNPEPLHYKNLRYDLKDLERVHINGNLVLLFRLEADRIVFEDLTTHEEAYRR